MKKTIKQDNFTILKNNNNEIIYQNKIYEKIGVVKKIENEKALIVLTNKNQVQDLTLELKRLNAFLFQKSNKTDLSNLNDIFLIYGSEVFKEKNENNKINEISFYEMLKKNFHLTYDNFLHEKNVFNKYHCLINGENYLTLQLLNQHGFNNKIDCIIIDPPYNTENLKMKYNDVFYRNEWIDFMKNRLIVAKELLSDDGVIFIHINDKEYAYLKILMDEIFQEENFIENFIWQKNSIKNNSKTTSNNHEYILCFAKNKKQIEKLNYFRQEKQGLSEIYQLKQNIVKQLEKENKTIIEIRDILEKEIRNFYKNNKHLKGISQYKFVDDNLNIFRISDVSAPNKNGLNYDIIHPVTKKICKNPSGGYRYNEETLKEILEKNLFYFGKDENTVPQYKRYLVDVEKEVMKSVITNFDEGYNDLKKILPDSDFNNPKPVSLIKTLLNAINKNKFIVLDFFAGSGTIIQAVNEINCEQNKNISCFAITSNENDICNSITLKRFQKVLFSSNEKQNMCFNYVVV